MKNKIKIFSLFILVFTMLNINLKQICFNDTNVVNAYDEVTNYYSSIDFNQTGLALRGEVRDLITSTHKNYTTYSGLRNVFKTSDADVNKSGNIIWFYSGTSVPFNGAFGSSKGATNREHVWPKNAGKAFDAEANCGSDAHHLRPVEFQVNTTRSDNSFNEVATTSANIVKQNGSSSYDNLCYTSGGFFYPGEGYRGATARILMYVQTRWGDTYNLRFVDGAGKNKTIGKISTLMKWHLTEPVTDEEKRRNEAVYKIQGNRNPFIDHPELASKIYCNDGEVYNNALKKVVDEYGDYGDDEEKVLENIVLYGNASKTSYVEGEKFDPTGLNVIGIYEDGSTKKIDLNSCKFVDATTYSTFLSKGTTSVICVFDNKLKSYNGIEVKEGKIADKWTLVTKINELKENDKIVIASTKWRHTGIAGQLTDTYLKAITDDSQFSEDLNEIVSLDENALIFTIKGDLDNCELVVNDKQKLATDKIKELNLLSKGNSKWSIDILNADATIHESNTNGTILYNANFTRFTTYNSSPTVSMLLPQIFKFDGLTSHVCNYTNEDTSILYLKEKATCINKAKYYYSCKECGAKSNETFEFGEALTSHSFDGVLHSNAYGHYYKCNKCEATKALEGHNFIWIVDKEATAIEEGLKHEECSVCHYKKNENTIVEKIPHNHEFGKWNVVKEASTTEEGLEERICSICNEKETRSIAKLEENKGCKGNVTVFPFFFIFLIALFSLKKKYN